MLRRLLKLGVPTVAKFRYQQVPQQKQFEEIILNFIRPHHLVLDAGCGTRISSRVMKGSCRMVVGIDADERLSASTRVDQFIRADLNRLPFRDNVFDIVTSSWVLEHLGNPEACFAELARIAKDDAIVIYRTPNLWHYKPLLAALTPLWFHNWFRRHVVREDVDSFPTKYKTNTPKKIAKIMRDAGFTTVETRCIDPDPAYLNFLTPLYAAGLIYHRLVSHFNWLSSFRLNIISVFRRQRATNEPR